MDFRLEFTVQGLGLDQDRPLEPWKFKRADNGTEKPVIVVLRPPITLEERYEYGWHGDPSNVPGTLDTFGSVTMSFSTTGAVYDEFKRLADSAQLERADDLDRESPMDYQLGPKGKFIKVDRSKDLSSEANALCLRVQEELLRIADEVTRMLLWRCGTNGDHPVLPTSLKWARGRGANWYYAPVARTRGGYPAACVQGGALEPRPLASRQAWDDVQQLSSKLAHHEPLGHELRRQAWDQMRLNNARSSVVLAIAAAEIGIKEAFRVIDPHKAEDHKETDWLNILEKDLPCSLKSRRSGDRALPPPPSIHQLLRTWNDVRDNIVHGPRAKIHHDYQRLFRTKVDDKLKRQEDMEELLFALSDLLWLLDHYSYNCSWATKYVREETLREWRAQRT